MVIQLQTSSAQRKPSTLSATGPAIGGRSINLFVIISIIIFFAAAVFSGSVFFYKRYLLQNITTMEEQLVAARKSFEPEFVDAASRLDRRIEAAKELFSAHLALSPLFELLEKKTLESVRFADFRWSGDGKDVALQMSGQAKSFNAVALQSDVFGQEKYFQNPVFSNFSLNDDGDVIFSFKTTVSNDLLLYRETILTSSATEENQGENTSF